jgi:hypothetical protein
MKFFQLQNCSAKLLLYLHSRYVAQNKQINSFSKCRKNKIAWTHTHIHTKDVNLWLPNFLSQLQKTCNSSS